MGKLMTVLLLSNYIQKKALEWEGRLPTCVILERTVSASDTGFLCTGKTFTS